MVEDNLFPYRRVSGSLDREMRREAAETRWWNQFLPGRSGDTATVEIEPPASGALRMVWEPAIDGDVAGGEIVWTWLPAAVGDGGYGPVLVVGRADAEHFYAVRLSTTARDGGRSLLAIGAGPKNADGRLSWADVDHIYRVHAQGLRRRRFAMDAAHFARITDVLHWRYGWAAGE